MIKNGRFKIIGKIRNSVFKEDLNYFLQWWKEAALTRINDMRAPDVKNNWQAKATFGWLCVYVKTAIATLQIIIAEKTLGYYYQLVLHSTTVRRFCNCKFSLDKSTIFSCSPNGFHEFRIPNTGSRTFDWSKYCFDEKGTITKQSFGQFEKSWNNEVNSLGTTCML